jgi:NAD(P)-dependent dehydrogenase (short-subunit alcohol dehydrogenase family)
MSGTALIVGAGPGLSTSLARAFVAEGMRVALAARTPAKLDALCAETGAVAFACDTSRAEEVARLFAEVDNALGVPDFWSRNRPRSGCCRAGRAPFC